MLLFSKLIQLILFFLYVGLQGLVVVVSCAIIVVFLTKIFRNLDLGIRWILRCKAIELESLRCIISCFERVVVVRNWIQLMGHTSAGRSVNDRDLFRCVTSLDIPRASGGCPPRRGKVYRLAHEAPLSRGMLTGLEAFLKLPGAFRQRYCAWTHLKKALCHIRPVGGTEDKYRCSGKTNIRIFSLETQSPKGHLCTYTTFVLSRSSVEGEELLEMIRLEVLNLL